MQRGTKVVVVLVIASILFSAISLYAILYLRSSFTRQLLVVRATNDVSSDTPGTTVPADFGPHCAPAMFAQSGALIVDSDRLPLEAIGVLFIEYVPTGAFATIGDGVGVIPLFPGPPGAAVNSSVNAAIPLFTLEARNTSFAVAGTEYAVGQTYQDVFVTTVDVDGTLVTVTETYAVVSLGSTVVTVQPPSACM